ncbi:hypothetical protein [Niallia sp. NCCP-28]|uniref:hypothetical protein n=1 Tax=Niallia sp. NCCP-28 TaxID=2934712 RepID=UPI0020BF78E8|nr:hypothetical protein [Niallia sp. NCCP-28]
MNTIIEKTFLKKGRRNQERQLIEVKSGWRGTIYTITVAGAGHIGLVAEYYIDKIEGELLFQLEGDCRVLSK